MSTSTIHKRQRILMESIHVGIVNAVSKFMSTLKFRNGIGVGIGMSIGDSIRMASQHQR